MENPRRLPVVVLYSLCTLGLFLTQGCRVLWTPRSTPREFDETYVYVGTYTDGSSEGIYLYHLDLASGKMEFRGLAGAGANPSFVAVHPNERFLYAVNELSSFKGQAAGAVSAFEIDRESGKLTFLNQRTSHGGSPCHVDVDGSGNNVLVANFGGGNVAAYPIEANGQLSESSAVVAHSTTPGRAHAHSINVDPANRFAAATDLGLDKVFIYRLDPAAKTIVPNDPDGVSVAPGAGPRHFAFRQDGRFAYVINERNSTVTAFSYDAEQGVLTEIQTLSTLPPDVDRENSTSDVQVHPSGRFLYGANRGHDSIVVYSIDSESGKLTFVEHESTQGKTPRGFGIDPTGTFLLAGNQNTETIVLFRIDPDSGKLEPTGDVINVPRPVCVKFLPIRNNQAKKKAS